MTDRIGTPGQHGRVRIGAIAAFAATSLAAGALLAHQGFAIGGTTPSINTGALTGPLSSATGAAGSSSGSVAGASSSGTSSGTSSGMPADKATVSGSQLAAVSPFSNLQLLSVSLRTSTPEDLLLSVTLECSILTQVSTTGTASSSASGTIDVWVTVDGNAVPVVPTDAHDQQHGQVTFCNRDATQNFTDGDANGSNQDTLTEYLKTKTANGFNWANLDTGNGIHTVAVWASFRPGSSCTDAAPAANSTTTNCTGEVGNRTLTIQPTKFAN